MNTDFRACEIELKKNIDILEGTFSKFGLEVINVGVEYANMLGGKGIKFFCEIMSNETLPEKTHFNIKINVYNANGDLISMGSKMMSTDQYMGYDTFEIAVFHKSIHDEAAKVRIYLTK